MIYFNTGLAKDMISAPGFKNKVKYLIKPPGWIHTGEHKTAKIIRSNYISAQNSLV